MLITDEERAVFESIFKEKETFTINSKSYITLMLPKRYWRNHLVVLQIKDYYFNGLQIFIGFIITFSTLFIAIIRLAILRMATIWLFCFVLVFLIIKEMYKLIQKREYGLTILMLSIAISFCFWLCFFCNLDKDYLF
jgi:hypothetical protein